jgi:hypothetical protein
MRESLASAPPRTFFWILVILLASTLFHRVHYLPLRDYRETRIAQMAREAQEGHWLIPHLNGTPYLNKPPLAPWMVAASFKCLGVGQWQARLPVILATLWSAIVVGWLTRRIFGKGKGLLGATLFLGAPGIQYYGRMLMSDVLAMAWMVTALAAFLNGYLGGGRRWYSLGFAACGLGVMSKGLTALVYPVGALILFALMVDRRVLKDVPWLTGGLIFLILTAPWFILVEVEQPGFLHHHLVRQQLERVVAHGGYPFVALPRWQLLLSFLGLLGPVALLIPWTVGAVRGHGAAHRIAWIFGLVVLVSVLLSAGRNHPYTVPAIPAMICVVAGWLGALSRDFPGFARAGPALLVSLTGAAILGCLPWIGKILEGISPLLLEPGTRITVQICLGIVGLFSVTGAWFIWRGKGSYAAFFLAAVMVPGALMLSNVQERISPLESRAYLGQLVARETPAHWPLIVADPSDRQFEGTGGWGFYARRRVLMVEFESGPAPHIQTVSKPDWIISADELLDEIIAGRPMALAATREAVEMLDLRSLPPPAAHDNKFTLWILRSVARQEGGPPPGPGSTTGPPSP